MKTQTITKLKKTAGSAMLLALGIVLPFLTGQIPQIGNMLCPMHIPVLICGMLYGPFYGGAVGFILPLLRSMLFTMPPMYPAAVSMAFEMLTYGVIAGLMVKVLPKKASSLYASLITAMLSGRIVWAIVRMFITVFGGAPFTFAIFVADGFVNALPGIVLHIAIIPPIVLALRKAKLAE
jgi:uncharacterized membrane protein